MTCETIEPDLVAYHFAVLDDDARERVESHLASCGACVRAFVELKRAIERADDATPAPCARAKLRDAVARELGIAPANVARRRWERPLALALAASVVLLAGRATHAITSGPGTPPYGLSNLKK